MPKLLEVVGIPWGDIYIRVFSGVYMGNNGQISQFSAQYGANEPTAGAFGPRGGLISGLAPKLVGRIALRAQEIAEMDSPASN